MYERSASKASKREARERNGTDGPARAPSSASFRLSLVPSHTCTYCTCTLRGKAGRADKQPPTRRGPAGRKEGEKKGGRRRRKRNEGNEKKGRKAKRPTNENESEGREGERESSQRGRK